MKRIFASVILLKLVISSIVFACDDPTEIDLSKSFSPLRNQENLGTCYSYTVADLYTNYFFRLGMDITKSENIMSALYPACCLSQEERIQKQDEIQRQREEKELSFNKLALEVFFPYIKNLKEEYDLVISLLKEKLSSPSSEEKEDIEKTIETLEEKKRLLINFELGCQLDDSGIKGEKIFYPLIRYLGEKDINLHINRLYSRDKKIQNLLNENPKFLDLNNLVIEQSQKLIEYDSSLPPKFSQQSFGLEGGGSVFKTAQRVKENGFVSKNDMISDPVVISQLVCYVNNPLSGTCPPLGGIFPGTKIEEDIRTLKYDLITSQFEKFKNDRSNLLLKAKVKSLFSEAGLQSKSSLQPRIESRIKLVDEKLKEDKIPVGVSYYAEVYLHESEYIPEKLSRYHASIIVGIKNCQYIVRNSWGPYSCHDSIINNSLLEYYNDKGSDGTSEYDKAYTSTEVCNGKVDIMQRYRCKKDILQKLEIPIYLTSHDCTEDGYYLVDKNRFGSYLNDAMVIENQSGN